MYIPAGTTIYYSQIGYYQFPYPDPATGMITTRDIPAQAYFGHKISPQDNGLRPVLIGTESFGQQHLVWTPKVINDVK